MADVVVMQKLIERVGGESERPPAAVITLTGRHMFVPKLALITTDNNGAEIPELTWS